MRRLTEPEPALDTRRVDDHLARHLLTDDPAPVAVALSGGSDSTALLALVTDWARRHGRRVTAITVDHGLNPASAAWSEHCRALAQRLRCDHVLTRWEGDKPAAGLAAAARAARHALLARAARAAGARVLVLGHTADDLAEAALMRAEGSSVGDPLPWAPSPAWPDGRGLMLLRPLLDTRRQDLRSWLAGTGLGWIDDPANDDPRFARARARQALRAGSPPPVPAIRPGHDGPPRLAAAIICASGRPGPLGSARLARLAERVARGDALVLTLGGSRISGDGRRLVIARELGRHPPPVVPLKAGEETVWDGRVLALAHRPGWSIGPLKGHAARLDPQDRAALDQLPALARPGLPVLFDPDGRPRLSSPAVNLTGLVQDRLAAAVGEVTHEAGLLPPAGSHGAATFVILSYRQAGILPPLRNASRTE